MATGNKVAASAPATTVGTEDDLNRLRQATKEAYEKIRDVDEDDLPPDRIQEYWRDRYFARAAWEHAENAAFENLVDQQKQQLPAVTESNAKLAKDVQATANVLALLDLVSASLGILASVITLLA
jgi:isopentenyl diphosphate isomerase/L-lactate dehydrogenase-like FMN-dependent dehydrogenase